MPSLFRVAGYRFFFWSNEGDPLEPVHIHVTDGQQAQNAPKIWVSYDKAEFAEEYPFLKDTDKKRILRIVNDNRDTIISAWIERFGDYTFYSQDND